MGTITEIRPRSGGGPSTWCAQIRIQRGGAAVFSTSQTFKREAAARTWLKKKEEELARPGGLERAIAAKAAPKTRPTLGDAIERTLTDRVKDVEMNRPGFTGGANSPRMTHHGPEDQQEAVFSRVSRTRRAALPGASA